MTASLATKQDLAHLEQVLAVRLAAVDARFDEFEKRNALMLQDLESRIVLKLGTLMTLLFGLAGAAMALLR